MSWLLWGMTTLGLLIAVGLLAVWWTGRFTKRKQGPKSSVRPVGQGGRLDDLLSPLEARHPDHSGVRLADDPVDALRTRHAMAQLASRSLDLMYYIWDDDLSGRFLAQALLQAADRGVRVRLLLDDVNVLNRDPNYRALDRHPQIEVRLFNPIRNRGRGFRRGLEILLNLLPYNRRMHGKLWITDGRLAMSGGRNIGDAYFGLRRPPGHDCDDLDTLLAGRVLRDAEALFDQFWNSGVAIPIRTVLPGKSTRLRRFRKRLTRHLEDPENARRLQGFAGTAEEALALGAMHWAPGVDFLGDPPHKALAKDPDGWMPATLLPLLRDATHSIRIMTPYFVPGQSGLSALIALAQAGVNVTVITNGLALSDNVFVHGAYRWYRARLLAAGVTIYEVAPQDPPQRMLHAKALEIDGNRAFVGSFNFDQRSAFMNTELGIVFDDPALVGQLQALFDEACTPTQAYCVSRSGRWLAWSRGDGPQVFREPESSVFMRGVSFLVGHMPIHRFL